MKSTIGLTAAAIAISVTLLMTQPSTPAEAQSTDAHDREAQISLQQQVIAKEREGLDALKIGNLDHFGALTADEAILVDAHGPASKMQVMKNVAEFRLTDYSMEDVHFLPISPNTGLISYTITEKGISHGHEFTARAYVSSVWTERDKKWICLFSQETTAR